MTDQQPDNKLPEPPPQPEWVSTEPVRPVQEEPRSNNRSPWIVGLVLIAIGLVFLLQNFGVARLDNWWALFILIPAVGSLANAWRGYQDSGRRFNNAVRGQVIGGMVLLLVAAVFLFGLNWGLIWPVFLIIFGIGALASGLMRD